MSCLPPSTRLHCLRPSSTGNPVYVPPKRGHCHASLHRHAFAASCRILPPVGASPRGGPFLAMSINSPMLPPVISYWRTQLVHHLGRLPATPASIGTPMPPPEISYQCTRTAHLRGGEPLPRLYHRHSHGAFDRLLPAHPGVAFPGGAPATPPSIFNVHASFDRHLPVHTVEASLERAFLTPPSIDPSAPPQPPPTGTSRCCISREGPPSRLPTSTTLIPSL